MATRDTRDVRRPGHAAGPQPRAGRVHEGLADTSTAPPSSVGLVAGMSTALTLAGASGAVDVSTWRTHAARHTAPSPYSEDDPPASVPAWEPRAGDQVAERYELVEPLGRGGHGEVWTAKDRVLGEIVALKWMFQPGGLRSARARREIALLRMLRMPGVVSFVDEGIANGCAFVVMEVVRGAPFPGARGPVPWSEVAPPTLSLLEVLSRVHARGVVHRDLKPANVLVDAEGRAVVLDFGVSRWTETDGPGRAGLAAGTPAYMAPEQRAGDAVDGRADLYSVGVMLFEALTGELPGAQAAPPAHVPPHVAAAVARLLAPRSDDRFRSAEAALRGLEGASPERARRASPRATARAAWPSERSLRALFAGPERLFHLRTDAARALWERTGGARARVDAEIDAWIRLGLARRTPQGLAVERSSLAQLRLLRPSPDAPTATRAATAQDPGRSRVLAWLSLAVAPLSAAALAEAMGEPEAIVNTCCASLVAEGSARRVGGRYEALGATPAELAGLDPIAAHRSLAAALAPGEDGRLYHLIAASDAAAAASEAITVASRHVCAGDLPLARAALLEGLGALRRDALPRPDAEVAVLTELARVAFEDGTPMAHDLALHELSRSRVQDARVRALEPLVRAALLAPSGRLPDDLPAPEDLADAELCRRCHRVRVLAASARVAPREVAALLPPIEAWASRSGSRSAALCLAESSATLHYAAGDFEAAARHHLEATRLEGSPAGRVTALLGAASALLEAFLHRDAQRVAARARRLAVAHRHPLSEARAEWLLRSARYRSGDALRPDLVFVDAVDRLGVRKLAALARVNEAAIALRSGDLALVRELAGAAARAFAEIARTWGSLLARALAISAGAPAAEDEAQRLRGLAIGCPVPGIGLQALALLSAGRPEVRGGDVASVVQNLVRPIPIAQRHLRMDVLSAAEAITRILTPEASA